MDATDLDGEEPFQRRKWRLNKPGAITRPRSKRLRKLALYSTNGSSGEREMGEAEGETGDGSATSK